MVVDATANDNGIEEGSRPIGTSPGDMNTQTVEASVTRRSSFRFLQRLSMKNKVLLIVVLFIMISIFLVGLNFVQTEIMNSVRSYVRGEGLWAKAQKDAVLHLYTYADTGDEREFNAYLQAIRIPQGDRLARVMLQSDDPDLDKVFKYFKQGQNHPHDIDGMINFFLRFQHLPYMSDAIAIWTEADGHITELQQLGDGLRQAIISADPMRVSALLKRLETLNGQLALLENQFSLVLSEGARWVKQTLMIVSLTLIALMMVLALLVTRQIVRGIEKTEKELKVSEQRFRSLYQYDMLGIVDWLEDGRLMDANETFLHMLGYQRQDLEEGKLNWRDLTPADNADMDNKALAEIAVTGYCKPFEKEFVHRDGHRVPIYLGAALLDGENARGICFVVDLSERKRTETELMLAATVFNASSNGIMVTDERMNIIATNHAFSQMCGYSPDELLGKTPATLRSGLAQEDVYEKMWQSLGESGYWQGDMLDRGKDGSIFPVHLSITQVRTENGAVSHYVAIFTDITERKATEDQLRKMAHHDYLTGLANRSLFHDRLSQAIQRAKRFNTMLALMFVDLDRFKPINDELGHEVGDKLLQEVAERLKTCVRENDTVARLGGDEFVILVEDLKGRKAAAEIAEAVISEINRTILIDGHSLSVGCSLGVALYPADSREQDDLIRCADHAMYLAKSAGRNCYRYYHDVSTRCEK